MKRMLHMISGGVVRGILGLLPVIMEASRDIYIGAKNARRAKALPPDSTNVEDISLSELKWRLQKLETLCVEQGEVAERLSARINELSVRLEIANRRLTAIVLIGSGCLLLSIAMLLVVLLR